MVHERYRFVGTSTETCCRHGDRTESKDIRGETGTRLAPDQHARLSRHTAKPLNLCRVEANKEVRENFFIVRCWDMWNSLPHAIQAEEDLVEFKKLLDWHHSIVGSF